MAIELGTVERLGSILGLGELTERLAPKSVVLYFSGLGRRGELILSVARAVLGT